eukprot:6037225-Karenia_brevis.AAC.1
MDACQENTEICEKTKHAATLNVCPVFPDPSSMQLEFMERWLFAADMLSHSKPKIPMSISATWHW